MPLLGPQLVFTLVMSSIMQKVILPYHSFAQWLIARGNLKYFNYPSDDELKKAAGIVQSKGRHKRNRPENLHKRNGASADQPQTFSIPKNIDIDLTTETLHPSHLLTIRYYAEYKWLLDFVLMATIVYTVTEAYYAILDPKGDLNLSLIWMVMGMAFTLHVLFSLTSLYFKSEDSGEMALCVTFGFLFLVLAMAVVVIDEDFLEFGVDEAYDNFLQGANQYLENSELESQGPMSRTTFEFALAFVAAILGAFMTFPGLRLAKMHLDALRQNSHRVPMQILLYTSFLFPMFIGLLWVKPVARDYIRSPTLGKKVNITEEALMSDETFDIVRFSFIPVFAILRIALMTEYLQAYLNMAHERIEEMKKEAGRITSLDLQKKVIRVFYYLCVVALQYMAPVILLFCLACLLKTSAGYSYGVFDYFQTNSTNTTTAVPPTSPPPSSSSSSSSSTMADDLAAYINPVREAKLQISFALSVLKQVFSPVFFRGVFSFLLWWVCMAWFVTSSFGIAFHSYASTSA